MKKLFSIGLFSLIFLLNSCSNTPAAQTVQTSLSAVSFAEKMKAKDALIIDVRTPEEFAKGHLSKAINIDWNGDDFDAQIAKIDRSARVFIYCLSGARSASAAGSMRNQGFKTIFELDGGILQWRANNLPETTDSGSVSAGMSRKQFDALLQSNKMVLIDFYADWCGPCKIMEPYLQEIAKEMSEKMILIRINADDNPALCKELGIDALPTLKVYQNSQLRWSNVGLIDKAGIVAQLQ